MLLENRHIAVVQNANGFSENAAWKLWKVAMLNRSLLNMGNAGIKDKVVNKLFKDSWGMHRSPLQFASKTFADLWKEHKKS